jgi:Pentapeptide repeats (9 copies)
MPGKQTTAGSDSVAAVSEARSEIEWDDGAHDAALKRVAAEGGYRRNGVRLSSEQLTALLKAAPRDAINSERAMLKSVDFHNATFNGDASFDGATFNEYASFEGVSEEPCKGDRKD